MNHLNTGKDKLKKICDVLRTETLEPAKNEADKILEEAKNEAKKIIEEAKRESKRIIAEANSEVERKNKLFESSLSSASKQALLALRQEIEKKIFNDEVVDWIEKTTATPEVAAQLIEAIVTAVVKDGIDADFSAAVASTLSCESVNVILGKKFLEKLKEKSVVLGNFKGGIEVKLHNRKIILDLSSTALAELMAQFLRKDFQKHLFVLNK